MWPCVRVLKTLGQRKTVERLQVMVGAASNRNEPLKHILYMDLSLGKATLAHIVANELSREVRITSGPVIDKRGDLAGLLQSSGRRNTLCW